MECVMKIRTWFALFNLVIIVIMASPAAHTADSLLTVDFRQVHVAGELGRRMDITVDNNLLKLNVDRDFLEPFKSRNTSESYIGLGKLIDAVVHFAASRKDERLLTLKRHLVETAIASQDADGYIGLFPAEKRIYTLWDIHEMSYLILALSADYKYFAEKSSLQAAQRLADYILKNWRNDSGRLVGKDEIALHMAVTGSENAFLQLYQMTKEPRYLDFVQVFRKLAEWEGRIAIGRWGQIEGHAYAYLCRCVAQMRLYRTVADDRLLGPERKITDFMLNKDGMVVSGAVGDHECWHDSQEGRINLGETCATAYLIRFWDELLRQSGNPVYGDLMERSIYNALFAAQSPDGRKLRYYSPFEHPRSYFSGDTYCCPCNYRRIVAELDGLIFYRQNGGAVINLYTPSTATIPISENQSVKIVQETRYPSDGRVVVHIEPSKPAKFPLYLRIPSWCKSARVAIDGESELVQFSGNGFVCLEREWRAKDRVVLDMNMPWRLVSGRKAQSGRVAVMRGPMVFGLNPAGDSLLTGLDLASIVLDDKSFAPPQVDTNTRPDGMLCQVKGWKPGEWYPFAKTSLTLKLTEFPDPGLSAAYFKIPNPNTRAVEEDELFQPRQLSSSR
jgi:uncharacterized protein